MSSGYYSFIPEALWEPSSSTRTSWLVQCMSFLNIKWFQFCDNSRFCRERFQRLITSIDSVMNHLFSFVVFIYSFPSTFFLYFPIFAKKEKIKRIYNKFHLLTLTIFISKTISFANEKKILKYWESQFLFEKKKKKQENFSFSHFYPSLLRRR